MKKSLEFGFRGKNQNELKQVLELLLKLKFTEHETSDEQDYLWAGEHGGENFSIRFNYNDFDKYWIYPNHQHFQILFIINNTPRSEELQKIISEKIPELVLLEVYEEEEEL